MLRIDIKLFFPKLPSFLVKLHDHKIAYASFFQSLKEMIFLSLSPLEDGHSTCNQNISLLTAESLALR